MTDAANPPTTPHPTIRFLKPIVKVIAHTAFHGVPLELMPPDAVNSVAFAGELCSKQVQEKGQDTGTDMERLMECAGRACYDSYGNGRNSPDFHQHIKDVDHGSVCEHASISFFLGNISRGLTHELVRHRVGIAISQRSTRYVDENNSEWVWHPLLEAFFASRGYDLSKDDITKSLMDVPSSEVELSMRHVLSASKSAYRRITGSLQDFLMDKSIDKLTARKQARGAARGLLGNALLTEMVWTTNVRTLRNVILKQRANAAADAEIRAMALRLWEEAMPYFPAYLGDFKRRPSPDGLADELYLPNSPVERLRVATEELSKAHARIALLEAQVSLQKGDMDQIGVSGNGG